MIYADGRNQDGYLIRTELWVRFAAATLAGTCVRHSNLPTTGLVDIVARTADAMLAEMERRGMVEKEEGKDDN